MLSDLCCKKKPKWSELLYIQIFIALCLDNETQKEFKTCVAHGENSSKDMEDILIYPMGPRKQRGAAPCPLGVAVAPEEATVPAAAVAPTEAAPQTGDPPPAKAFGRKLEMGMKRGLTHIQEPLLCTLGYPRGHPQSSEHSQQLVLPTSCPYSFASQSS